MTPKATSVDQDGEPDNWTAQPFFRVDVDDVGQTRVSVSVPPERLVEVHQALVGAMDGPFGVMYLQLTDRRRGKQLPTPRRFLALDQASSKVMKLLKSCELLVYADARHQLWVRGKMREQVVLDELGTVFCYPDDPAFRDVLEGLGIPEVQGLQTMTDRDYVKVNFDARADGQEELFIRGLGASLMDGA